MSQQFDNFQRVTEQRKLQDKERTKQYGFQLQQELALREKQKEVDKAERASDLGTANRKKEEYEVMVEQFKQQQLMMKDYLKDDYEQVLKSQRIDKHQRKA